MGEKALVDLSSFFKHHIILLWIFTSSELNTECTREFHSSSIFSRVMNVCAAILSSLQLTEKQNLCKTQKRKKRQMKAHLLVLFSSITETSWLSTTAQGWRRHQTLARTSLERFLQIINTDCIRGWTISMWKITPLVGQITLFPTVYMFTGFLC